MSDDTGDYIRSESADEIRDTIVKSGLTGVAATVLAVAISSPAGLGGMIGTSIASGFGVDPVANTADDPYANLPAFPAPLTSEEVSDIRGQLAATAASLEITRAATEAKIEQMRMLAAAGGAALTLPAQVVRAVIPAATSEPALRVNFSEPDPIQAEIAPVEVLAEPVSYSGGGSYQAADHDPHMELATLLLDSGL